MKNLKEYMQQELNESRIKDTEVANYIKSWLMEVTDERSAWDMIMGIEAGVNMAIMERNKFMDDDKNKKATRVLEKLSTAIGSLQ